MSQELEAGIGGLYSILTQELQLPLVRRVMYVLQRQKKMPPLPKSSDGGRDLVHPRPVTGLEAIGRGDDRNKLVEFITTAQQVLGPEVMAQYINIDEAMRRLAASNSIDITNLVKTREELEAEKAQAATAAQQKSQQDLIMAGMQSPALAQVAKNYTAEGAPYGPQIDPNEPNSALPTLQGLSQAGAGGVPGGPTGGGAPAPAG